MRWRMEFFGQRSGTLACYSVEAPSPAAAVVLGRKAAVDEHPPVRGRRRRSTLFERAERLSARDDSGWVLYRIGKDDEPRSADAAPVLAT